MTQKMIKNIKHIYIHIFDKSWAVKVDQSDFDKELAALENFLNGMSNSCWVPVHQRNKKTGHILLTEHTKKYIVLEVVETTEII